MLALAGYRLGMTFRFFDEAEDACAAQVGPVVRGGFYDERAIDAFARGLDGATFEFENVPSEAVARLGAHVPVYPSPEALEICQDRVREKTLFAEIGIPTADFLPAQTREEFDHAIAVIGTPCVVKTRRFGYDGKGQALVRSMDDVHGAWSAMQGRPMIIERFVPFRREVSVVGVRARTGETKFYPIAENTHRAGILRLSVAPAFESEGVQRDAEAAASRAMEAMGYVGVLCIEFFEHEGRLLANEMAPRVHNSGHWTMDGAETSQFENHLRAVAGLPLGSTRAIGCSAMLNLIGVTPALEAMAALPGARVHLYGKAPRAGRKLGHVNFVAGDRAELERMLGAGVTLVAAAEAAARG
jgi:5-(carboxyamino)imidazole ribonucleotide synthase